MFYYYRFYYCEFEWVREVTNEERAFDWFDLVFGRGERERRVNWYDNKTETKDTAETDNKRPTKFGTEFRTEFRTLRTLKIVESGRKERIERNRIRIQNSNRGQDTRGRSGSLFSVQLNLVRLVTPRAVIDAHHTNFQGQFWPGIFNPGKQNPRGKTDCGFREIYSLMVVQPLKRRRDHLKGVKIKIETNLLTPFFLFSIYLSSRNGKNNSDTVVSYSRRPPYIQPKWKHFIFVI